MAIRATRSARVTSRSSCRTTGGSGSGWSIKPGVRYQKQFWPDASYDVSTVGGDRLQYDIRQGGSVAPRIAAAYDPAGDGRTSIHAAHGRYDDYQILASVVTGQIVNGSSGVRTLAASAARIDCCVERSRPPAPRTGHAVSKRGDLDDARSEVPYAMHTAVGIDRAIGEPRVACRQLHPRARPVPARHDRLQPDRARRLDRAAGPTMSTVAPPRRRRSCSTRPSARLVPRPDGLAEQRFSGLDQFLVSYTLSKAEDTSTDFQSAFLPENNGVGRDPANPTGLPLGFDPARERGTGDPRSAPSSRRVRPVSAPAAVSTWPRS